jgi:amino acid transporter
MPVLTARKNQQNSGLAASILSSIETFAQSVAGIAPTAAPVMTIAIVYSMAGNGAWLTYLIAMLIMLATGFCINVFASRLASSGSLYTYVTQGSGKLAGFITGWSLLGTYVASIACCPIQFSIFVNALLQDFGQTTVSPFFIVALCLIATSIIACLNIKLSAELMLWIEITSIAIILVLCACVIVHGGFALDIQQLSLKGVSGQGIFMGLVMAIFASIGFESSASLGVEANQPTKKIPQAIVNSVLITGVFFIFTSYVIVQGFEEMPGKLAYCPTPVTTLANHIGFNWLGKLVNLGAAFTFFACALAGTNAAARILFTMSRDGFCHSIFSRIHHKNRTPMTAIIITTTIACGASSLLMFGKQSLMDIVGYLGSIATYCCLVAYVIVSISASLYLKKINQLRVMHIVVSLFASLAMVGAFIGTLCPIPPAPYCWLPLFCLTYFVIGLFYYGRKKTHMAEGATNIDYSIETY